MASTKLVLVAALIPLFILGSLASIAESDPQTADFCWKPSYGRGVGKPLSQCPNAEKNGLLCYPFCKTGYRGVGPVCWQDCPAGYNDDGAFCRRNAHIYGKGCCCSIFTLSCCNSCPSGYNDDSCTCRKDAHIFAKASYGRSVGYPMSCGTDEQYDAGLCYQFCNKDYKGVGAVCWGICPTGWTDCGASCAKDALGCVGKIVGPTCDKILVGN